MIPYIDDKLESHFLLLLLFLLFTLHLLLPLSSCLILFHFRCFHQDLLKPPAAMELIHTITKVKSAKYSLTMVSHVVEERVLVSDKLSVPMLLIWSTYVRKDCCIVCHKSWGWLVAERLHMYSNDLKFYIYNYIFILF